MSKTNENVAYLYYILYPFLCTCRCCYALQCLCISRMCSIQICLSSMFFLSMGSLGSAIITIFYIYSSSNVNGIFLKNQQTIISYSEHFTNSWLEQGPRIVSVLDRWMRYHGKVDEFDLDFPYEDVRSIDRLTRLMISLFRTSSGHLHSMEYTSKRGVSVGVLVDSQIYTNGSQNPDDCCPYREQDLLLKNDSNPFGLPGPMYRKIINEDLSYGSTSIEKTHCDSRLTSLYHTAASNPTSTALVWTNFLNPDGRVMSSLIKNFHDDSDEFRGTLSLTISLEEFNNFLDSLKLDQNGILFLIDQNTGLLLASSSSSGKPYIHKYGQMVRLKPQDCNDPIIRDAAYFLLEAYSANPNDNSFEGIGEVLGDSFIASDGEMYYIIAKSVDITGGFQILDVFLSRDSEIFSYIYLANQVTTSLCVSFVLLVSIISYIVICVVLLPLSILSRQMKKIETMSLSDIRINYSCFLEIRKIQKRFRYCVKKLEEFRCFLPDYIVRRNSNHQNQILADITDADAEELLIDSSIVSPPMNDHDNYNDPEGILELVDSENHTTQYRPSDLDSTGSPSRCLSISGSEKSSDAGSQNDNSSITSSDTRSSSGSSEDDLDKKLEEEVNRSNSNGSDGSQRSIGNAIVNVGGHLKRFMKNSKRNLGQIKAPSLGSSSGASNPGIFNIVSGEKSRKKKEELKNKGFDIGVRKRVLMCACIWIVNWKEVFLSNPKRFTKKYSEFLSVVTSSIQSSGNILSFEMNEVIVYYCPTKFDPCKKSKKWKNTLKKRWEEAAGRSRGGNNKTNKKRFASRHAFFNAIQSLDAMMQKMCQKRWKFRVIVSATIDSSLHGVIGTSKIKTSTIFNGCVEKARYMVDCYKSSFIQGHSFPRISVLIDSNVEKKIRDYNDIIDEVGSSSWKNSSSKGEEETVVFGKIVVKPYNVFIKQERTQGRALAEQQLRRRGFKYGYKYGWGEIRNNNKNKKKNNNCGSVVDAAARVRLYKHLLFVFKICSVDDFDDLGDGSDKFDEYDESFGSNRILSFQRLRMRSKKERLSNRNKFLKMKSLDQRGMTRTEQNAPISFEQRESVFESLQKGFLYFMNKSYVTARRYFVQSIVMERGEDYLKNVFYPALKKRNDEWVKNKNKLKEEKTNNENNENNNNNNEVGFEDCVESEKESEESELSEDENTEFSPLCKKKKKNRLGVLELAQGFGGGGLEDNNSKSDKYRVKEMACFNGENTMAVLAKSPDRKKGVGEEPSEFINCLSAEFLLGVLERVMIGEFESFRHFLSINAYNLEEELVLRIDRSLVHSIEEKRVIYGLKKKEKGEKEKSKPKSRRNSVVKTLVVGKRK